MTDVLVPNVGESVSSGVLTSWFKQEGDIIQAGENLFELETDKATMEIPATLGGKLHITVEAGNEVEVGKVVAQIDEQKTETATAVPKNSQQSSEQSAAQETDQNPKVQPISKGDAVQPEPNQPTLDDLSPSVRRLMEELDIDPKEVQASQPGARLSKEDIQNYIRSLKKAGTSLHTPTQIQHPKGNEAMPSQGARQERVPMTGLRKRIAERLVQGKQSSAHLTTFNEVDMSAVIALRRKYKELFEEKHGVRLGFMSFFLKASASALLNFSDVNAYVDGTEIVYNNFVDISVAISSKKGLITPVVRGVDSLSFSEIELMILDFSKRAQEKKILPDELMGGTFTISNGGIFGSMLSTPIPNPPQTAILGMHTIQERPVVVDGEIVIRPIMYLALTYDHRVLDGREAIGFLKAIKMAIEDPSSLLLEV